MTKSKIKPRITRVRFSGGRWFWAVQLRGDTIYAHDDLTGAFHSAAHVWKYQ